MADNQNEKADGNQWFLRTGGEAVFGPVSAEGLVVWAEQGRILPGHEVSADRKKWVPAVSVAMLDMRWFVDDGKGELRGPLNRLAAEELIKSGKVSEGAQIVSADDVESAPAPDGGASAPVEKSVHDQVPEEVLRVRVRELESMVMGQRDRLAKLANADAIETVQHERDVLASLVKEVEKQRDTILRNAEKDTRTFERKTEHLRAQVRKLEQQLEEANSRLPLSDALAASAAAEREQALEHVRREAAAGIEEAQRQAETLREKAASLERELADVRRRLAEAQSAFVKERESLSARVAALEQAVEFHEKQAAEARQTLATREGELEAANARAAASERKCAESEAAFAELLNDANARDNAYADKVAALEKACAQPPDETARFFSDQAAVYDLVKAEIDELSKSIELERSHVEQMKEWSAQRQQALVERKQVLLKQLGESPADMTRRALREQPSDPNAARLRAELDDLKVARQREAHLSEDRERELQRKLRVMEAEAAKLRGLALEGDKQGRRAQELSEQLRKREQELADERKSREAEREQFQGSQQALLMRIETLEKSSRPTTPDEIQSAEARNVKIATWMRLKK